MSSSLACSCFSLELEVKIMNLDTEAKDILQPLVLKPHVETWNGQRAENRNPHKIHKWIKAQWGPVHREVKGPNSHLWDSLWWVTTALQSFFLMTAPSKCSRLYLAVWLGDTGTEQESIKDQIKYVPSPNKTPAAVVSVHAV